MAGMASGAGMLAGALGPIALGIAGEHELRGLPVILSGDIEGGGAAGALVATLKVPNHFKRDWIRRQYAARIEAILTELAGRPTRLELALVSRDASSAPIAAPMPQCISSRAGLRTISVSVRQ